LIACPVPRFDAPSRSPTCAPARSSPATAALLRPAPGAREEEIRSMSKRALRSFAVVLTLAVAAPSLAACGHGEEEWQAELAKQKRLQSDLEAEKKAHKQDQDELKRLKDEVADLKASLEGSDEIRDKMGKSEADRQKLEKALADAEARVKTLEAAKRRLDALRKKLEDLKKFNLKVAVRHNQIVIEMPGDVLFSQSSDKLQKDGEEVLLKLADVLKGDADLAKRDYQVIGHTDNKEPAGSYKDAIGLSAMRAREVYHFLTREPDPAKKLKGGGLPAEKWSAAGFGSMDPVAGSRDSQSDDDRKKNRRVEIAIVPDASELMKLDVD
jgi:chemotaxis protein MotB